MADQFVNPFTGNDANPGTEASPKATFLAARNALSPGANRILLARGFSHVLTEEGSPRGGTSPEAPFEIMAYGTGPKPRLVPGWTPPSSTQLFWHFPGANFVRISDIVFDAQNATNVNAAFSLIANAAVPHDSVTIQRCEFVNSIVGFNTAVSTDAGAGALYTRILVNDCESYNNARHGFYFSGTRLTVRKSRAHNNGIGDGGHGFSSQGARRFTFTSGWTLVGGTTYSRAQTYETWGVFSNITGARALSKNTATPTAPAVGQYGWSGGTLYVNFGSNPNGPSVVVCSAISSVMLEDCEAWDNKAFTPYAWVEGTGFQFDDWTSFCAMRRCVSRDNPQGFVFNNVADCEMDHLVSLRAARYSFVVQRSRNIIARNLTAVDGNRGGMRWPPSAGVSIPPGDRVFEVLENEGLVLNNVAIRGSGSTPAIRVDAESNSTTTINGLRADGVTGLWASQTPGGTNREQEALQITPEGRPLPGSPLLTGGADLGYLRDIERKQSRRHIGAYGAARLA